MLERPILAVGENCPEYSIHQACVISRIIVPLVYVEYLEGTDGLRRDNFEHFKFSSYIWHCYAHNPRPFSAQAPLAFVTLL